MPTYQYSGRNADGSKASGVIDAPSEEMAAENLLNRGVIPTQSQPGKAPAKPVLIGGLC